MSTHAKVRSAEAKLAACIAEQNQPGRHDNALFEDNARGGDAYVRRAHEETLRITRGLYEAGITRCPYGHPDSDLYVTKNAYGAWRRCWAGSKKEAAILFGVTESKVKRSHAY